MAADETDKEQRTEQPSARRMAQAREEGDLPIGRDAAPVASLAAAAIAFVALGPALRSSLGALFGDVAGTLDRTPFGDLAGHLARPAWLALAICGAAALGAAAATVAQTQGGFWTSRVGLDPTRLWRGVKVAHLLSKDFLLDLLTALAKVVAIAATAWLAVRDEFAQLPSTLLASPADQLSWVFGLLAAAVRPVLVALVAVAGLDLAVVRWKFMQKMRMTREEAKREMKEEEGDPLHRGKRKRRHREIVLGQARREVPRADAVVVNPTHVAVAIRYRRDEGRAPRVTAKGKGVLAEHIRALAREHGIPIVEDVPLARLLYRKVRIGREIPAATYKAVAAVLAFVYRVTGRSAGARA